MKHFPKGRAPRSGTSAKKPTPPAQAAPARRRPSAGWVWVIGCSAIGMVVFVLWPKPGREAGSGGNRNMVRTNSPLLTANLNSSPSGLTNLAGPPTGKQKDAIATELTMRGNNLLKAGDSAGALQVYKQALALTPDDEDVHFNLGIAYVRAGDVTKAEHEYKEALRLLPDYPEVHNNLGNLLLRAGRLSEAEQEFTEALKAMPEYAQAHNNMGILRQKQARLDDALQCFQKAVQYDTNYWEAHFNLGGVYLHRNEREKAIAELRETLRLNPDFEPGKRALAKALGQGTNAAPPVQAPK